MTHTPDQPCALFLDVDGTLLDIAPSPAEVRVPVELTGALGAAARALGGALALVSGRAIADLDRLFRPLRLPAAGQHGAEIRRRPEGGIEPLPSHPIPAGLREAIAALGRTMPGVLVEDKGRSIAVHYRGRPAAGQTVMQALARLIARDGAGLSLICGKMVVEIRDPRFSKASAVASFMAEPPFAGRRPIFLGDDRADEDGFAAAEEHGGLALPVGRLAAGRREAVFAAPSDVRDWLARLPRYLETGL